MIIKLFRIEFRKQLQSAAFWILVLLHTIVVLLVATNFNAFLRKANIAVNDIPQVDFSLTTILQFPDIWQNMTYIAGFFKIILAVILISSISNEFSNSTARQNIANGLSRKEWIFSKLGLNIVLAVYSTLLVVAICAALGFSKGTNPQVTSMFSSIDFVLAYLLELVVYFIYALFIVLLVKRSGISIILLLVYDFLLEPILAWSLPDSIDHFLPMSTLDNLNTFPFGKYVGNEVPSYVALEQFIWAIAFGVFFAGLSYVIFKKLDL